LVVELDWDFGSGKWLFGGVAGEESGHKCSTLEQRRTFMTFRGVIYMDVGGYKGKMKLPSDGTGVRIGL
jgi:hypothetical protein